MTDIGSVTGSGRSGKGLGVVLGSTAYKLLHRSTVPVLVVPAKPG
jgi:nucleotide-binding universal stress UspA family protein